MRLLLCVCSFILICSSSPVFSSVKDLQEECKYGEPAKARTACEKLLQDSPKNLGLLLKLSEHLVDLQLLDEAEKHMKDAVSFYPDSEKARYKLKKIESYIEEREWLNKRKKENEKKKSAKTVLSPELQINKIRCMKLKGEKALNACNELIKKIPDDYTLYQARGKVLSEMGRKKEAEKDLRLAMKYNPAFKGTKLAESVKGEMQIADSGKSIAASTPNQNSTKNSTENSADTKEKSVQEKEKTLVAKQSVEKIEPKKIEESSKKTSVKTVSSVQEKKKPVESVAVNSPQERKTTEEKKESGRKPVILATKTQSDSPKKDDQPKVPLKQVAQNTEPIKTDRATEKLSSESDLTTKLLLLQSLHERGLIDKKELDRRKHLLLDATFSPVTASEPAVAEKKQPQKKYPVNPDILGNYHALVIGIQDYKEFPRLVTPKKDVRDIAEVLDKEYGFSIKKLLNPSRRDIIIALQDYREKLKFSDNLLIYYAGHGWLDEEADAGYWLPAEASPDNDVDWLSLNTVISSVRAIEAKHILIVADSCFAGKLTRGLKVARITPSYYTRIAKKRARVVMTSGGLEPVLDSGGGSGNSVFADAFLKALKENETVMDGATLFTKIRRPVMLKAQQTPEYSDIRRALHEGGDFIFPRRVD